MTEPAAAPSLLVFGGGYLGQAAAREAVRRGGRAFATSRDPETRQALAGQGIVCLSDFMTAADRRSGALVPLFAAATLDVRQAIHAVYYRNTALAPRITCFVDHIVQALSTRPFSP